MWMEPGQANHFVLFASARSDYGAKRYLDETRRLFSVLDDRLKETGKYLVGDKYTIADICTWGWVNSAGNVDIDISKEFPALHKWWAEIAERPAVKKGKNVPPRRWSDEEFKERAQQMKAKIQAMENSDKHP
jgi:glutathione S-transferase